MSFVSNLITQLKWKKDCTTNTVMIVYLTNSFLGFLTMEVNHGVTYVPLGCEAVSGRGSVTN